MQERKDQSTNQLNRAIAKEHANISHGHLQFAC